MRHLDRETHTGLRILSFAVLAALSWQTFAQDTAAPEAAAGESAAAPAAIDTTPVEVPEEATSGQAQPAAQPLPAPAPTTSPVPVAEPPRAVPAPTPREPVETRPVLRQGVTQNMSVPIFKSGVLALAEPAARISVGNPDIADILILRSTQLYVLGKDIGSTNVIIWDRNDNLIGTVAVEITHDLEGLKTKLYQLLPEEDILVYSSQRNIVLAGQVSSVINMEAALRIAEGYLAQIGAAEDNIEFQADEGDLADEAQGQVVNLMQIGGGQQVMLEVKVAEIARTELRSIEAQMNFISKSSRWSFGGVNGGAQFPTVGPELFDTVGEGLTNQPFGPLANAFVPNTQVIDDKGLFASYLGDDFLFNMALNASKENGLARILAEPTLTTLTGQEAEFLSGGEFPIPVPQGNDTTTIEFKDFGVGLKFLPVVLGNGVINLKVNISVSELQQNNSLVLSSDGATSSFFVPALTKRSAQATYELRDGQTIGVAGLINENLREVINKFPGLGDLPILGALFRSQSFIKGESELMILVTPRLAKPLDPNSITLPTDAFVEPSDADFYLLGRMEGRAPSKDEDEEDDDAQQQTALLNDVGLSSGAGGTDSEFGHQVQ